MKTASATFLGLSPVVSAHFKLDSPAARGFDEDLLVQFPCGVHILSPPPSLHIRLSRRFFLGNLSHVDMDLSIFFIHCVAVAS